ncbi:hypothetical protein Tco_0859866 [Tanacetum coccineum]|uniref:Ty3 transposon capsid-like protein domain-containing protein n=1 Tax=Tanacetum coccineum TaxID=301880 RepID=A0ABQ5BH87_9ASTR
MKPVVLELVWWKSVWWSLGGRFGAGVVEAGGAGAGGGGCGGALERWCGAGGARASTEGVMGLCQWFEKLESVFRISDCKERDKVKLATATLQGRALTWWNARNSFLCRIVNNLKLKGTDIDGYTKRFHELALLCFRMVEPEQVKVEQYIRGLSKNIRGDVTSSRPTSIDKAVYAYQLMGTIIQDKMMRFLKVTRERAGKDFSRRITPLLDTMMVQPVEEMGKDLDHPTDSTPIPIIDQPSSSSQPKKDESSKKAHRREAEVPQDEAGHKESVPTHSNDPQPSAKDAQAKEITALKKRIQRLERRKMSRPTGLKRLNKFGMSRRVESSKDQESLAVLEDASKQGRSIKDIDADVDVDVMHVEAKVDGKDEQSKKPDDSTASEAIKAAKPKVVTTAATTATTTRPKDRGVVVQEPSEFRVPQETQPSSSKDKGKGIMIEPEVPLKRKDQIALDEQIARDIQAKLDAELLEEQKLARKQEEEANIALIESWENT